MSFDPINDFLQGRPVDEMDLRVALHGLLESHKQNLTMLKSKEFKNQLEGLFKDEATRTFVCSCGDVHELDFEHTVSAHTISSMLQIIYDNLKKQSCLNLNPVPERFHPKGISNDNSSDQ